MVLKFLSLSVILHLATGLTAEVSSLVRRIIAGLITPKFLLDFNRTGLGKLAFTDLLEKILKSK